MPPSLPYRPLTGRRRRAGLTLFELLIVMSILAALVALIVGLGRNADITAKRYRAQADLGHWHEALHRYYVEMGQYPAIDSAAVSNLLAVEQALVGRTNYFGSQAARPLPQRDPWGRHYWYTAHIADTNNAPQSYDLFSQGPNAALESDDVRFK